MAGRGVDIKLGGNPEHLARLELAKLGLQPGMPDYDEHYAKVLPEIERRVETAREQVLEAGGLFILGTERHESRRIDNQLRGRSGRQGDPGESRFFLSRPGRPRAAVRRRADLQDPRPARHDRRGGQRGADRGRDALQADREGAAEGRGAALPDAQAHARVRRRAQPAARGDLHLPRRDPRGARHERRRARGDREPDRAPGRGVHGRRLRRGLGRRRAAAPRRGDLHSRAPRSRASIRAGSTARS